MIDSKDRAGWFGASDTSYVVGNRETASFKKWWLIKMGLARSDLSTKAMRVGNAYEHKVLDAIRVKERDKQILIPELKLRVNLDGNSDGRIFEVKTHQNEFKVTKQYWRQAQVEMFAWKHEYGEVPQLYIVAYRATEDEYRNYFKDIDECRLSFHKVEYDETFIEKEYLPKLKYLRDCMEKGIMPKERVWSLQED